METALAQSHPLVARPSLLHFAQSEATDDELARKAQAGVAPALEELTRRYRGRIYVFALALLQRPDDAEVAAQETLVRAFRWLPADKPRGHFRTWLFGIAANVCREHGRSEWFRFPTNLTQAEADLIPEAAPGTSALSEQGAVRRAVARLPKTYRAPVVLYYLEDLGVAEVASILRQSQLSVKMRLWRARALLSRELTRRWE